VTDCDFAEPHDLFVQQFAASWPLAPHACRGPILDLGCGPADVVVSDRHFTVCGTLHAAAPA
jgi:hypothetical protein